MLEQDQRSPPESDNEPGSEPSTSTPRSHLQDLALVVAEDANHVRRVNV